MKDWLPKAKLTQVTLVLALLDGLYGLLTMLRLIKERLTVYTNVEGQVLDIEVPVQWRAMARPFVFVVLWLLAALMITRRDRVGRITMAVVWLIAGGIYFDVREGFASLQRAYQSHTEAVPLLFTFQGLNEWDVVRGGLLLAVLAAWLVSTALKRQPA